MNRNTLIHDVRERLKRLPPPQDAHYGVVPLPPPEDAIGITPIMDRMLAAEQALAKIEALACPEQVVIGVILTVINILTIFGIITIRL